MKTITVKNFHRREHALGETLVRALLALPGIVWTVLVWTVKIILIPVVILLAFLGLDLTGSLCRSSDWD